MPERAIACGPRVLVTRPAAQAERLTEGLRRLGCQPVALPSLVIETVPQPAASAPVRGVAIFTSRNAVERALRHVSWPWPGVHALAIGAATAEALALAGCTVALVPRSPFDSEAMLDQLDALPPGDGLRRALVQGVTIVTGEGGRATLGEQLQRRGYRVKRLELYRRLPARPTRQALDQALMPWPDLVSCSSDASLHALLDIVKCGPYGEQRQRRLQALPLLVNGKRCATLAREAGFVGPILIACPAGDTGQLSALERWLARTDDPG